MSGGRVNTPVNDGSTDPLARISELERLWPIMQMRMQQYDTLISDVQTLKEEVEKNRNQAIQNADQISKVYDMAKNLTNYVQGKFDFVAEQASKANAAIENVSKKLDTNTSNINAEVTAVKENVSTQSQNIMQEVSKKAYLSDLLNHSGDLKTAHSLLGSDVEYVKKLHLDLSQALQNIKTEVLQGKTEVVGVGGKYEYLNNQMSGLLNAFESLKEFSGSQIYASCQRVSNEFDEKIKAVKAELSDAPDSLRSEFNKKLEGVSLDGSNAILRSTNAISQISILEKKIENILLRLKAIELPK